MKISPNSSSHPFQPLLSGDTTNAGVAVTAGANIERAAAVVQSFEGKGCSRDLVMLPHGRSIADLSEFLDNPPRFKGEELVNDAASFLNLLSIHKDKKSVRVYLSSSQFTAKAIVDDHEPDKFGHREHTIAWKLRKHRDLVAWETLIGDGKKGIDQLTLLEFLDDRIKDITAPDQGQILGIISDLNITTDAKFQSRRDIRNGSFVLHCDAEHKTDIEVPDRIEIGVPIFEGLEETAFKLPIRLRYTVSEGKLAFRLIWVNKDDAIELAWNKAMEPIRDGLGTQGPAINVP